MSQHNLQADHVLKDYLDDPVKFCEFSNYAYFHGQRVIRPEMIIPKDTDQSTYMYDWNRLVSLKRQNDKMKMVVFSQGPVHMGMEVQSKVDYTMVIRAIDYTYLCYDRQKRKNMRKKEAQNFIPAFVFVLYCGEGKWTGTQTLEDSVNLPEEMRAFFQDFHLVVIDIKKIDLNLIYDEDTRSFVEAVQKVYQWDGNNKEDLKLSHKLSFEAAVAAASAVGYTELIDYFYLEEGGVDMCTSISRALDKSEQHGYSRGRSEGFQDGEQYGYHQAVIFMLEAKLGKLSEEVKIMVEKSSQELLNLFIRQLSYMRDEEDIKNILMAEEKWV